MNAQKMNKVASKVVKNHEAKMHGGKAKGYADGGMVSKHGKAGCGHRGGLYGKDMKK